MIAVIYKSKYGATQRYAKWLAEALGADLWVRERVKAEQLHTYDTLIYGGGIYAGGIAGISLLKNCFPAAEGQRLAVFAVGAAPETPESRKALLEKNFTPAMAGAPLFMLRGAMDFEKMTLKDRMMMNLLKKMLDKKPEEEREEWEKSLMSLWGRASDWCDPANLQPILNWVEN